jgi:hypothetical protein
MALYMMAFSVSHIFGHNTGMNLIERYGFTVTWNLLGALQVVGVVLLVVLAGRGKRGG